MIYTVESEYARCNKSKTKALYLVSNVNLFFRKFILLLVIDTVKQSMREECVYVCMFVCVCQTCCFCFYFLASEDACAHQ